MDISVGGGTHSAVRARRPSCVNGNLAPRTGSCLQSLADLRRKIYLIAVPRARCVCNYEVLPYAHCRQREGSLWLEKGFYFGVGASWRASLSRDAGRLAFNIDVRRGPVRVDDACEENREVGKDGPFGVSWHSASETRAWIIEVNGREQLETRLRLRQERTDGEAQRHDTRESTST